MVALPDLTTLSHNDKDALIVGLSRQLDDLETKFAALEARFLELSEAHAKLQARLGLPPKTPDNSSLPPSQGQKPQGEDRPKGKKRAHPGVHRPLHPDPTSRRDIPATHCQHCRTSVSRVAQKAVQSYDRIEVPLIKPDVTRVTLLGGLCPCCDKTFKAVPPEGLEPGSPFGPNLRARALHLGFTQGLSFERLAKLSSDMLGVEISEGALVNIMDEARAPFARQVSTIRERLLGSAIIESDETRLRVGKKNWWLWVFHHDQAAVFVCEPTRGKCVPERFLGNHRPLVWVSDRYGAQMGWSTQDHQVCLAHLIRDVQYVIKAGDTVFAPALRHLLGRACRLGQRRDRLSDATLKIYKRRLDATLDQIMTLPPSHEAGAKLKDVIKTWRRYFFVFMTNRTVPPTNNGSERALRPCVTFRKITKGFRTPWDAKLYADVRSVIEAARRSGIAALDAIRDTIAGKEWATAAA